MNKITCLYYSFLREFDSNIDGFTMKDFVKWYQRAEPKYPYQYPLDVILDNWNDVNSGPRANAMNVATIIRKKIVALASRKPLDGKAEKSGDLCIGIDGVEMVDVYESFFPGGKKKEVIPKEHRRKIVSNKNNVWTVHQLSDLALVEKKTGNKTPIAKMATYAENRRKDQDKLNAQYLDVQGHSVSELDPSLRDLAVGIQKLKGSILRDVEKMIDAKNKDDGENLTLMIDYIFRVNEELKGLRAFKEGVVKESEQING